MEISKNDFLRQFETKVEGKLIKLEYSEQGKNTFLSRLKADKALEDSIYIEKFIGAVLDYLSENEAKVVPSSKIVAKYFKENKSKYKHLLPIGINF